MPEIPEVEAFKFYIIETSLKKKIIDITAHDKNLVQYTFKDFKKELIGHQFTSPSRRGKYLIIPITSSQKKLIMHFGLTGSLAYKKSVDDTVPFSKVTFVFDDNSALHWINKRKFGKLWLIDNVNDVKRIKNLGPDALQISESKFVEMVVQKSDKNIKSLLMDQQLIAGIGNEYSDEILFQAGIDPRKTAHELSNAEIKKLYTTMHDVLNYAIKLREKQMKTWGGNTFFDPKRENKEFKSTYLQAHRHYDMQCPKHKNHRLVKTIIGGRSTYYCPEDQK
jgi:formamidopyrimidine-DNA glycosylase